MFSRCEYNDANCYNHIVATPNDGVDVNIGIRPGFDCVKIKFYYYYYMSFIPFTRNQAFSRMCASFCGSLTDRSIFSYNSLHDY